MKEEGKKGEERECVCERETERKNNKWLLLYLNRKWRMWITLSLTVCVLLSLPTAKMVNSMALMVSLFL